jgi:hypothetical protein
MSNEVTELRVVAISEGLANAIRNYLGQRPYDEVVALQQALARESADLTPQIAERLKAPEST